MEKDISARIIDQAKKMGASVAGIANVYALKKSPSHFVFGKLERYKGVGTKATGKVKRGEIYWPEFARSAVVIGIEHPADKPELDCTRAPASPRSRPAPGRCPSRSPRR